MLDSQDESLNSFVQRSLIPNEIQATPAPLFLSLGFEAFLSLESYRPKEILVDRSLETRFQPFQKMVTILILSRLVCGSHLIPSLPPLHASTTSCKWTGCTNTERSNSRSPLTRSSTKSPYQRRSVFRTLSGPTFYRASRCFLASSGIGRRWSASARRRVSLAVLRGAAGVPKRATGKIMAAPPWCKGGRLVPVRTETLAGPGGRKRP
ncbi:hypothetical protein CLV78_12512 [Aliiruegeria haliotis]|uniref:Uncharacterized protein n=1 Tax=Aliiruegeria haliotis TaxID=1280846 RepID=A0A2T0RDQ6_9RHOB|nr:hypothetical protein CLV78_12512 [Aliiruegeria haliotis]